MQGAAGSGGRVEAAEQEKWWGLYGTAGIMTGPQDLMMGAYRCQESTKVIYDKLDVG